MAPGALRAAVGLTLAQAGWGWLLGQVGSCLPQAVQPQLRRDLRINGASTPFRVYAFNWTSAQLLGELVAIFASEVLGYNTVHDLAHADAVSDDGYLATMGCAPPYDWSVGVPPCVPGALEDAAGHVALEVRTMRQDLMQAWKAARPGLWPANLGSVGYGGQEGIYLRMADFNRIENATGLDLSWYSSWTGAGHAALADRSVLPPPLSCEEVRTRLGAATGLASLELDGLTCLGGWWAWPLCAQRVPPLANCTPILYQTASNATSFRLWGAHNMPGTIGFYSPEDQRALAIAHGLPFYAGTPSEVFAPLNLVRIGFPEHNPDDWKQKRWPKTDQPTATFVKLAVREIGSIAPDLQQFLAKLQITIWEMTTMLLDYDSSRNVTDAACNWLRQHNSTWSAWRPEPSDCVLGQGVSAAPGDSDGGELRRCEFCTAGSFSNRSRADRLLHCDPCPRGRFQGRPGSSACEDCPAGQAAASPGTTECTACAPGSYSGQPGSSSCQPCPTGLTTKLPGAARLRECLCSPGSYGASAWDSGCRACPAGHTTAAAGAASAGECVLKQWVVALVAGLSSALFGMVCVCALGVVAFRWRLSKLLALKARLLEERLQEGLAAVTELAHPLACVSVLNFMDLAHEELVHEELRDAGVLLALDSMTAVHAFKASGRALALLSYQWLSWSRPGPDKTQLAAMRQAMMNYRNMKGLGSDLVYLWLDIISIPQRNAGLKTLAVHSLYLYASLVDAIIVVAPASRHEQTAAPADLASYAGRVWCRAEQFAHICQNGLQSVYLQCTVDGELEPPPENWFSTVCCVFDGEMTCCRKQHPDGERCDRETLVPTMLGLYFALCSQSRAGSRGPQAQIYEAIAPRKGLMFPKKFQYATGSGAKERELFGDTIDRIEEVIDRDVEAAVWRSQGALMRAKSAGTYGELRVPTAAPLDLVRAMEMRAV